jgi:hypothetical protein
VEAPLTLPKVCGNFPQLQGVIRGEDALVLLPGDFQWLAQQKLEICGVHILCHDSTPVEAEYVMDRIDRNTNRS